MGGKGPPPKDPKLRQRTNKKPGAGQIQAPVRPKIPAIPNPDGREWQPLTERSWQHAWSSPMASRWLESDIDGLGRVAVLWDEFYKAPDAKVLAEIRLQEQRFGLSPLDRSRLAWEVVRGDEAEERQKKRQKPPERPSGDPRRMFLVKQG